MKKQWLFSFVLAALSFVAAKSVQELGIKTYYTHQAINFQKETGYFDLDHPGSVQALPSGILPFSDICILDSTMLIAIQQGQGSLVLYDFIQNQFQTLNPLVANQGIRDLATVDSTIYLIDEQMFVYRSRAPYDSTSTQQVCNETLNWSSAAICHHALTDRLFILPQMDSTNESSLRSVYTYNLNQNRYSETPLFTYDLDEVEAFANEHGVRLTSLRMSALNDSVYGLNLDPTAIAIHPKTNDVYVLSGSDRSIVVFDQNGTIQNFAILDKSYFPNPSGMTFSKTGDLLISNSDLMNNSVVRVAWNKLYQSKKGLGLVFGL